MEFKKLRAFLADETMKQGGEVRLGFSYQRHETLPNENVSVWFKDRNSKELQNIRAKVLVDASGGERQVLAPSVKHRAKILPATGIEYLVEVKPEIYEKYANALSVFMGHKWMPQGYSWIFPMEPNKLKVGVGRYFQNDNYVPHRKSYLYYLDVLMKECLGGTDLPILDKHGKTILYAYKQKDPYYDKNVIAIGDSISSINPLAFEGIRHAMASGRTAAKHIVERLNGQSNDFEGYVTDMRRYFGFKWALCELLMNVIYKEPRDERVDRMIETFRRFSMGEMLDLAFHYKLGVAIKFLAGYTLTSGVRTLKDLLPKFPIL
jgi:flavin-dependent dehydrogenase